ncbi:MAG: AMP-binding protein [Parasporobacterium sp.]|nr:AMP-binding protein [Parasporobacterium sp.]
MNTNIFLENAVNNAPSQTGLIFEDRRLTYKEIFQEVNKLTNVLLQIGCTQGTRIGTLCRNCPEMVFLYYAASRIGAIFVPFDYKESSQAILSMIGIIQPEYLFVDNDCINLCIAIHHSLPSVRNIISFQKQHASYLSYRSLMARASSDYYSFNTADNDPTAILFTSGATSSRKAVAFSHINFIRHVLNTCKDFDNGTHISISCTPFTHILGLQCIFSAFYARHTLVMMKQFDPDLCLRLIEKEHVSKTVLSPSRLADLLHCSSFGKTDLSSFVNIRYSGDLAHSALVLEAIRRLPANTRLENLYGTTETTYDITALSEEDHDLDCEESEKARKIVRLGSIGRPISNVKVIIANEKEEPLPPGEIGEILVHTDRYMIGYVSPETHEIEEMDDYWFHTDDIGYTDEDGYIFPLGHKINSLPVQGDTHSPRLSSDFIVYPCVTQNNLKLSEETPPVDFVRSTINQHTYRYFLHFLRQLYEASGLDEIIRCYLESLPRFLEGSMFGIHLLPIEQMTLLGSDNMDLLKWDMPYFDTLPVNAARTNIQDVKETLYQNSLTKYTTIQDYIEKIKPDHLICTPLFSQSRKLMGVLSFGRIGTNWTFNSFEQNLIVQISNHLCIALSKELERETLIRKTRLLEGIVQVSGIAVVITDPENHLLYKNQHAHIILEREKLSGRTGTILDTIAAHTKKLLSEGRSSITSQVTTYFLDDPQSYVLKTSLIEDSPRALITVISGDDTEMSFDFLEDLLTGQEINVITQVALGLNNAEIARKLNISVNTVKYHLKQIFQKMEVSTRAELLTKAYAGKKDYVSID